MGGAWNGSNDSADIWFMLHHPSNKYFWWFIYTQRKEGRKFYLNTIRRNMLLRKTRWQHDTNTAQAQHYYGDSSNSDTHICTYYVLYLFFPSFLLFSHFIEFLRCINSFQPRLCKPGWPPSSITCNLDVICPALVVFEAKQMRIEGFSFPATCRHWIKINYHI